MSRNKKRLSVLGLVVLVLGGCSSPSQIDYASIRGLGTAGGASMAPIAAVFGPGGLAMATNGPEDSRRDAALSVRDNGPRLATDEWSRDLRPSLRLQRRGRFTSRDGRSYLYYERETDTLSRRRW